MKKFYYLIIFLVAFSCFYLGKTYKGNKFFKDFKKTYFKTKKVTLQNESKVESKVFPITEEKTFVFVIPSFNNEEFVERNLRSVFDQKYQNYRVVYIDDASTDKTYEKVRQVVQQQHQERRVTLIRNEKNRGGMANVYRGVHSCADHEIAVLLDGDDWLSHESVLEKLNEVYADPDVWMTYGSYIYHPSYKHGECSQLIPKGILKKDLLRSWMNEVGTVASHLKTFYAGFCKQVKLQDVTYKGQFLASTWDAAIMLPMLEMGQHKHVRFIEDVLYVNNRANPINDDKVNLEKQQFCSQYVRSLPPYPHLTERPFLLEEKKEIQTADVVVFSYNRPLQLYAFLESFEGYAKNYGKVSVIYRSSDLDFYQAYESVKARFPFATFYRQLADPEADFKPLVLTAFSEGTSPYIIFAVDDIVMKDQVDFNECIATLKDTGAYGFYLRLGRHVDHCYMMNAPQGVPNCLSLQDNMYAWQFNEGKLDWKYPNTLDMTLYSKAEIVKDLEEMDYQNPNSLEAAWASRADFQKMGLCYENSKIVNIPLSIVNPSENRHMHSYSTEDLLGIFGRGLKMDISPLHNVNNKAAHFEHQPLFITR